MDLEFDKEMDALLRKAAGRGVLIGGDANLHLDADTIAAFAENALPVKSRTIYTKHLAACDPCRMSLANLISVNAAAEPAMAAAAAPVPAVSVRWYRKLFLAPNLAYVMGGLVLIFGGLLGLIVLQNSYYSDNATVSQIAESPETQNAPARAEAANTLSPVSDANSNAASNVPGEIPRSVGVAEFGDQPQDSDAGAAAAPPPPPVVTADTSTAAPAKDLSLDGVDKARVAQAQPAPANAPKREDDALEKKEVKLAAEQENRKQDSNQVNVFRNQQNQMMPNAGTKSMGPSRNEIQRDNRTYESTRQLNDRGSRARDLKEASGEGYASSRRNMGGKTFEMKQGAWYDSSYSGQKTRNVRRSSEDYRKLDAGLRNIADNIGGTIIIVWKDKAYRIQ